MKHYLFLATAIATASLFTGCSNNEYVGDQPEAFNGTDGAIAFSMGKANTTRAGEGINQLRANGFYVYGTKTKDDHMNEVFKNYKVTYAHTNTDKTSDNFNGWVYVGNSLTVDNPTPNIGTGENDKQTIKYWDYSANYYEFLAFSAAETDLSNSIIKVAKVQNDNAYTVNIAADADIAKLYFADYVKIDKPSTPPITANPAAEGKYGGYVKFTFRNLASKVRFGFYETVPGYSIQINKMYKDDKNKVSSFVAICPNIQVLRAPSQITVKYKPENDRAYPNYAYVASIKDYNANSESEVWQGAETFEHAGGFIDKILSNTSAAPTWYDNSGDYTFVWPQEDNEKNLKIKVDYTLTSTDGSREEINVTGATAQIPKEYVKWKANTAYTYIFKISDKTNGSTGTPSTDPAGLYPITFDAVVEDYANEGFITTVSTPSVTAKQDGTTAGYVIPEGIVFKTGADIDLKVMTEEEAVAKPEITGNYLANYDYKYNMTPEQNIEAAEAAGKVSASVNNTLSLGLQSNPGYWVLKVATSGELSAAFTYVIIRVDSAEEGPANPANP